MKKGALLGKLFVSTFLLSAFTFGGGYVIISLMKKKFVDELHWLDEEEMLDYTAIAQSCPGAVAVNASILVGSRVAGAAGMLVALAGTILPPLLIIGVLSFFYTAFRDNFAVRAVLKGMQAGVVAVILDVVIQLGGRVIRVLHTPGHAPGHMCFWEPERGYLFTGDLVYKDVLFAYYPSTDPEAYLDSLEKVAALPVKRVFPAHHSLEIKPEILGRMRDVFRELKAAGKLRHGSGKFDYGDWGVWL